MQYRHIAPILEVLRKLKTFENTDRWWTLLQQVERVLNGRYHHTLSMTPFEAFNGTMHIHRQLVQRREKRQRERNEGKRMRGEEAEFNSRDKVLVYEFEQLDRGRLRKLASRWTGPHVLRDQKSTSS